MTTKIELRRMTFYAYHGVAPQETRVGNTFIVDLILTAPLENAVWSDDLSDTINYATVYETVKAEMAIPSLSIFGDSTRSVSDLFLLEDGFLSRALLTSPAIRDEQSLRCW